MKYLMQISIVFLTLFYTNLSAQTFCYTPSNSENLELYKVALLSAKAESSYCLRIYVHVIKRTNGTGGQSVADINQALDYLNQDFNPQGVYFHWDSSIDYIDNDSYYNTPTTSIYTVNNHTDGIDIYLFDDASSAGGRANGVGENSEFWVSGSFWKDPFGSLVKSHVISHEMGHVLFLWHTHHGTLNEGGSDVGQCAELVNGLNSGTCGDYVSDTPADPYLQFNVDHPDCNWNGSGTDANGHSYDPDETMVMAYTHPDCMSTVSNGQGQRVRGAIATLPHLMNAVVDCGGDCTSSNLTITQNVAGGTTSNLQASNTITASNNILNNATANYKAGNRVRLVPGFKAYSGSKFRVHIGVCTSFTPLANNNEEVVEYDIIENDEEALSVPVSSSNSNWNFNIYPNPSKGKITIDHSFETGSNYYAYLYDFKGKLILKKEVNGQNSNLELNDFNNGMYIVKIISGDKYYAKKIILNR